MKTKVLNPSEKANLLFALEDTLKTESLNDLSRGILKELANELAYDLGVVITI